MSVFFKRSRGVMEALADECRRAARVTQAEWTRSAAQLAAACTVLGGSHVHPWRQLTSGLIKPPAAWPALREQLLTNLLCYRANYAQIVVAWCLVCVVRHPLRVVWLLVLAAGWFHVLLVRRSVLNIPLGKDGRVFTLMHRQLQGAVAAVSLVWLGLTGTVWLLLTFTVLPMLLILVHASVCPPTSNRSALVKEVQQGLAVAFRHKDADTEEMEGGSMAVPPPRDEELAKRVEQIRQKYRRVTRPAASTPSQPSLPCPCGSTSSVSSPTLLQAVTSTLPCACAPRELTHCWACQTAQATHRHQAWPGLIGTSGVVPAVEFFHLCGDETLDEVTRHMARVYGVVSIETQRREVMREVQVDTQKTQKRQRVGNYNKGQHHLISSKFK